MRLMCPLRTRTHLQSYLVELLPATTTVLPDAVFAGTNFGVTVFAELPPIGLTGSQSGVLAGVNVVASCLVFVVRVGCCIIESGSRASIRSQAK